MPETDESQADRKPPLGRKRPTGLGRGLSALMGDMAREEPLVRDAQHSTSQNGLRSLVLSEIRPDPDQPRRYFDDEALDELAGSIARRGVIQPVIVRPLAKGGYQLVAGERRWRAAQRARLHEIPAIVRDLSDEDAIALALIENIQREDLNPVEEAQAYQRLVDDAGYGTKQVAKMVDKSRSHVANLMRLLALPSEVLDMVADKRLSMGHARALINAENAESLAHQVVDRQLSVREIEQVIRRQRSDRNPAKLSKSTKQPGGDADNADIAAVERHLEDLLGLKVRIASDSTRRGGTVSVSYANLDQLDLICQRLSGEAI